MSFLLFFYFQNQNFYLYLIIISFKLPQLGNAQQIFFLANLRASSLEAVQELGRFRSLLQESNRPGQDQGREDDPAVQNRGEQA